ncbi:N-acetylneuraminate synthase family protein [Halovenus salina]|uniref:N-acetylneuraminate synthase family protein n=1 Tax=Halovenus salina TaxID=1510225 RepID=A0ABD5W3C9_9EURY|nr:N-acetylneuraminate synthase family protein [Halovenus salina]
MSLTIVDNKIGNDEKPCIIAEIGQAHDGSLGIAHSFIDAVAETGADAIKFQTHLAEHESTLDEPFRTDFSWEDDTRYEYWKRMEFTKEQWKGLAEHAREKGLIFLSSPFSKAAVDLLQSVDVPAWKIGSGEYKSDELVSYMADTELPVLFSTGMSTYEEIDEMTALLDSNDTPYALFQCTSKYPATLEEVGLNVLEEFRERYGCPVGLSDHTGSPHPAMAAISRGVDLLEVHVTFDRRMFGPDADSSLTFKELTTVVDHRDAVHKIDTNPVNKNEIAEELSETRALFSKSIAPAEELSAGTVITEDLITPKKPASGIPYDERDKIIGATLEDNVSPERLLTWDDIDA